MGGRGDPRESQTRAHFFALAKISVTNPKESETNMWTAGLVCTGKPEPENEIGMNEIIMK